MIYLDASYLVKLYADEPGAEAVLAWVEGKATLSAPPMDGWNSSRLSNGINARER